jgi:urease accessory protein UreF
MTTPKVAIARHRKAHQAKKVDALSGEPSAARIAGGQKERRANPRTRGHILTSTFSRTHAHACARTHAHAHAHARTHARCYGMHAHAREREREQLEIKYQ